MKFYLATPRKPKFPLPAVKPDLDNLIKSVTDALNGILWEDDGQITGIVAGKYYGEPRIYIQADEIKEP